MHGEHGLKARHAAIKQKKLRHPGAGRGPSWSWEWIPAFAGMTGLSNGKPSSPRAQAGVHPAVRKLIRDLELKAVIAMLRRKISAGRTGCGLRRESHRDTVRRGEKDWTPDRELSERVTLWVRLQSNTLSGIVCLVLPAKILLLCWRHERRC